MSRTKPYTIPLYGYVTIQELAARQRQMERNKWAIRRQAEVNERYCKPVSQEHHLAVEFVLRDAFHSFPLQLIEEM